MKNQLKKSLSFVMAVLMILSCWVWVAPEKAEAAAADAVYYVKYEGYIRETGNLNSSTVQKSEMTINFTRQDGTKGSKVVYPAVDPMTKNETTQTFYEGEIEGVPTSISWHIKLGWEAASSRYFSISQIAVYVGSSAGSCTNLITDPTNGAVSNKWQCDAIGTGNNDTAFLVNTTATAPKFTNIKSVDLGGEVNVNKLGVGDDAVITPVITGADQYGVDWKHTLPGSAMFGYEFFYEETVKEEQVRRDISDDCIEYDNEKGEVHIKPYVQTLFPSKANRTITTRISYGDSTKDVQLKLIFHTYTASFYPNGGKIGVSDTEATDSNENPIVIGDDREGQPKLYYGDPIGEPPAYTKKDGMTFAGYYSEENADLTSLKKAEDYFIGDKYNKDGIFTTVPESGDTKWYAAWEASKINATFMVGNQLLGHLEGRYDNSMLGRNGNMYNRVEQINEYLFDAYQDSGKDVISFDDEKRPVLYINGQKYTFVGWKIVEYDYDEALVNSGNLTTILYGDVTFGAQFEPSSNLTESKYNITFYNGTVDKNGNPGVTSRESYLYRANIIVPSKEPSKAQDDKYSYVFVGWAEYIGSPYYAVDENSNDITDKAYIHYTSKDTVDFIATKDVGYVPVFKAVPREYKVTFQYKENGEIGRSLDVSDYHFGDVVTVPEGIKDNYTMNGKRYMLNGWKLGISTIVNPIDAYIVEGDMTLTASYDKAGIPAEYTIRFFDMYGNLIGAEYDEEGNLTNESKYIHQHGTAVSAPTVGDAKEGDEKTYDIPQTIDTEDALYVFKGWSNGDILGVNSTAGADVDYTAVYEKKEYADLYFYNYDGTLLYKLDGRENSLFVGSKIPAYSQARPEREEDVYATYRYNETWKDSKGNFVKPGEDLFAGDTHLTAQYDKTEKVYTVKFLNGDEVVSSKTYKYGEPLTVIPEGAEQAPDNYYSYSFKAWEPAVSTICYGDATYNATFRRANILYTITWLDDTKDAEDNVAVLRYAYNTKIQQPNAPADPETYPTVTEGCSWAFKVWVRCDEYGYPLEEAVVDGNTIIRKLDISGDAATKKAALLENADEAEAAKINAMSDEEIERYYICSKAIIFERGMKMPEENIYFYPIYEEVSTKYEVNFYDDAGKHIGTAKIPYEADIMDFSADFIDEAKKAASDEYHYDFSKWVKKADDSELPIKDGKYIVNEDLDVKAVFIAEKHKYVEGEVEVTPTCNETGKIKMVCESEFCDKFYLADLDRLADNDAPEGTVYIGTEKWTMNNYTVGIDYSEDKMVYVNAGSSTIVNAVDIGTRGKNNPEAKLSRGVGKIEYAVVNVDDIEDFATFNPHTDISEGWTTIYNYDNIYNSVLEAVLANNGKKLSDYNSLEAALKNKIDSEVKAVLAGYNANATGILGGLNLENGNEYVIYLRLSDIEINGDVNISYMSTGRLHYGTEAAKITLSGEGYGTKFCEEVTIKITDDTEGFEAYIDGEKQNITVTSTGVISATFTNNKVGVHTLTVVDKNGNKSTKSFEIKNGHSYRNYTVAATCENEGSRYNLCTVCGTKNDVVALPAKGHSFTDNYTEIAPTCIVDGTRTYVCDNNCGEKLTVGPASGEEELKAVGITSADTLKHLLATKTHTYAKVLDDNGKETSQDAWVIDKAATCMVKGSKHKDCIVCGAREIEPIEKDAENGHKFYRARVEDGDEATCVKDGIKSETCRYCGYKRTVDTIPALGHTEGEYVVTLAPTCTTEGSKVLKCTECDEALGKPVAVPATGHKLVAKNEPFQGEGTDTKWYQEFKCVNAGCTYTEKKEVKHEEVVKGTVTFMNEEVTVATFADKTVGETILASDVAVPTKTSDVDYKYTFSHWATRTGEGTEESPYEYTAVKFPITVEEGNATYYAVFAKKNIKYTVTYYYDDQITQYKKVGYLNNAAEHKLEEGPEKAATVSKTYKFVGWGEKVEKVVTEEVKDADGNSVLGADGNPTTVEKTVTEIVPVEGDTVKINGKNIVLYAVYAASDRYYSVTYADGSGEFIETFYVKANTKARACAIEPEKDADSKYHYTFKSWNRSNQLSNVKSNIYASPEFTAVSHTYPVENRVIKTAATCTENAVYTYKCSCGRSYDKEEPGSAIGHSWGEAKYDETTGKNTVTCQIEGCGATEVDTRTFTFKFYLEEPADENAKTYDDVNNIYWGSTVDSTRLPADPEKDANEQYTYEFKGWKIKGDETGTLLSSADIAKLKVTKDYIFVADFDEIERVFKVIFAYEHSRKAIQVLTVKYGESAVFTEATPEKSKDTDPGYKPKLNHYTFKGWSADTSSITEDLIVYAKFEEEAHSYTLSDTIGEATCEKGAGYVFTCSGCGDSYEDTGKALGHDLKEVGVEEGYIIYKCTRCDHTESKPVDAPEEDEEEVVTKAMATVTVLRGDEKVSGIKVIIQPLGEDAPVIGTTNAYGVASFEIDKSKTYVAWVEIEGEKLPVSLSVGADGNISGVYTIEVADNNGNGSCGCACHRNNVWGAIFRFFHKIIKLFTGEFKCCANPDPMYG